MHIIDRRLNPKAKSLGNRQRFIRRAKDEIREAISDHPVPEDLVALTGLYRSLAADRQILVVADDSSIGSRPADDARARPAHSPA